MKCLNEILLSLALIVLNCSVLLLGSIATMTVLCGKFMSGSKVNVLCANSCVLFCRPRTKQAPT